MARKIRLLLTNWFFLFSTAFLVTHQIIQKALHFSIPILDNYGDDFFAMPFILTLFLIEQYFWNRRTTGFLIFEIVTFTLVFALFFELILPIFNQNYTKDYWDFLAYALGSVAFHFLINKKN
jgi:hypothetical protein